MIAYWSQLGMIHVIEPICFLRGVKCFVFILIFVIVVSVQKLRDVDSGLL